MVFNHKLRKTYTFFFILIFVLYSSISVSQEDNFDLDSDDFDLLEDTSFDQLELELANTDNLALEVSSEISGLEKNEEMENLNSFDSFSGNIIQKFTYGLQSPSVNFSRNKSALERIETIFNFNFKGELSPQLNYKIGGNLLYSWGKWKNNKFQTDENKSTFKIKDFYLDYYPSDLIWLRLGNQIIARGQLDNLSITDTINPRDLSVPGQGELSEFRQHVPAILLNFPISDIKIELALVGEAGGNLLSEKGDSFDPTIPFVQNLVNTGGNPYTVNYLNPNNELDVEYPLPILSKELGLT